MNNQVMDEHPMQELTVREPRPKAPEAEGHPVQVTNISMPFWSMVGFMLKWALASIPALVALGFIGFWAYFFFSVAVRMATMPH